MEQVVSKVQPDLVVEMVSKVQLVDLVYKVIWVLLEQLVSKEVPLDLRAVILRSYNQLCGQTACASDLRILSLFANIHSL